MDKPIMDHTHGVSTNKCGHPDCVTAFRRYLKRWQYERSHGLKRTVPVEEVREHLMLLAYEQQWSVRSIAGEAGVSVSGVARVLNGQQQRITQRIATKILALDPTTVPSKASAQTDQVFVYKRGAVRRLRALMVMGWPHSVLTERLGFQSALVLHQEGRWITRRKHDAIVALYAELASKQGPSVVSTRRALRYGYLSPAAWDDPDNDPEPVLDPDAPVEDVPEGYVDEVSVERRLRGDTSVALSEAEEMACWLLAVERGIGARLFTQRTGISGEMMRHRAKVAAERALPVCAGCGHHVSILVDDGPLCIRCDRLHYPGILSA